MPIVDLVLPKLGESIMEATILKWHKKVGDTIQLDETLLDIATDKVDSEIPSTTEGTITEILFEVNSVVPIGTVIARISNTKSAAAPISEKIIVPITENIVAPKIESIVTNEPKVNVEVPFVPAVTIQKEIIVDNKVKANPIVEAKFYSPLVLNIAQNEGVGMDELQHINGTGTNGRITKKDILDFIARKKLGIHLPNPILSEEIKIEEFKVQEIIKEPTVNEPATRPLLNKPLDVYENTSSNFSTSSKLANPNEVIVTGATEIIEMDRMRKLIAKHMVDSVQTSPHVTSFVEVDVTNMVVWRDKVKELFERREGTKITYTPMFLESIATVLEQFPMVNCSLEGDQIILKKDINIGMATALPTGNLIVPVIKGANQLSIVGITKAVNNLAQAARNGQLKPTDTQGGTFTVTNVGSFGSIMGTPIINQPQVAILALGAIKKRAVVVETPSGDAILVRHMMFISMSYDHRIVDGAMGSKFLSAVGKEIENWDPNRQWFQYV
ncbi:MAG: 2-oxo acid dehydrogenase subunit E2 [Sediminibacterium sp.]|nr:MAG: 2-oxo acid dehydrogenase subunit E2 [Sediminibacterium sp.]